MELFYAMVLFIVFIIYFTVKTERACNERDAVKRRLEQLTKKTQMELELDLATMDQLMKEVSRRLGPYILLLPISCRDGNQMEIVDTKIVVHGIEPAMAVPLMDLATTIMKTEPPDFYGPHQDEE